MDQCSFFACALCILGLSQLFTLVLFIHFAVCRRRSMAAFEAGARLVRPLAVFTFRSVFCLSFDYSCFMVFRLKYLQFNFYPLGFFLASFFFCSFNNHLFRSTCTGEFHAFISPSETINLYVASITLLQFFIPIYYTQLFFNCLLINHAHTHSYTQFVNFLQPRARSLHSFFVMTQGLSFFFFLFLRSAYSSRCTAPHFPSTRLTRMQGVLHFTLLHTHLLLFSALFSHAL